MKKWRSCLIVLVFIAITVLGTQTALADETGKYGNNITWTLDDAGNLTISGTGEMTDYPSVFFEYRDIKTVTIKYGVTSIGKAAFSYCSSLTSITMPNSVTSIGERAFSTCSSLTSITIPSSVTVIGKSAFSFCDRLTSISISNGLNSIDSAAFSHCSKLTSIKIPNSVTDIKSEVFNSCSSLKSIKISNNVTSIPDYAFRYCENLTDITIPSSVTHIGNGAFSHCSSLTTITIPSSVTYIGSEAFQFCEKLTSITIPSSVTNIRYSPFSMCENLTDIYYGGSEEQWNEISYNAQLDNLDNLTVHYNSNNGGNQDDVGIREGLFDSYLSASATVFNSHLALISADLSLASYNPSNSDSGVRTYLREFGFENAGIISDNYGGSLAYTIGVKPYSKDPSGETGVMVIVAQGSTNPYELVKDATAWPQGEIESLKGYYIYDIVGDFYTGIRSSMLELMRKYNYKNYKFWQLAIVWVVLQ